MLSRKANPSKALGTYDEKEFSELLGQTKQCGTLSQMGNVARLGNVSHLGNNLLDFCCSLLPDWETVSQMGNKIQNCISAKKGTVDFNFF